MVRVLYCYPMWHVVSFSLVARKHIEYMFKACRVRVYTIDELALFSFVPITRYRLVIHPAFYILHTLLTKPERATEAQRLRRFEWWRKHFDQLIGIDVCDSDSYSSYAVELANRLDKLVLPSSFCVEVARRSGIKAKIYRVPHGVDPEWYTSPNTWERAPVKSINPLLVELYLYRIRKGKKLLLFWLWHSGERKGWSEVLEVYRRLARERKDVTLVLKTVKPGIHEHFQVADLGAINVYGWLSDYEKMVLYDAVDVTLNFSRGGGFELNCLESLARGVPCIASDWGSWTDYVPPFLRVRRGRRVQPLPGNAIHSGYGYAVDVEDALNKLHNILDNLDDYKARTLEWREKVLSSEYRWDVVASRLLQIINE